MNAPLPSLLGVKRSFEFEVGSVVTAQRNLGFRMLKMSGFCSLGQPALESSKRRRGTGRITVDAREKGLTVCMMHYALTNLQGTELGWGLWRKSSNAEGVG